MSLKIDMQDILEQAVSLVDNANTHEELNAILSGQYLALTKSLMSVLLIIGVSDNTDAAMFQLDNLLEEIYYSGTTTVIDKDFTVH
ncbi:MAG: hypothetical protein KUG64_10845 [Cycloclasticus sp.]|nr:hypothetical protein [Cycloclasticus sp.]